MRRSLCPVKTTKPFLIGLVLALALAVGSLGSTGTADAQPAQDPTFSIARVGALTPVPVDPADLVVMTGGIPPAVVYPCPAFGLGFCLSMGAPPPGDDVNALSLGQDFILPRPDPANPNAYLYFSVAPGSTGVLGTGVNNETVGCTSGVPEPEADEFGSAANWSNYQAFDGDGVPGCSNPPAPVIGLLEPAGDDLDAVDPLNLGATGPPIFVSLDQASPSLGWLGGSAADIYMDPGMGIAAFYAMPAQLGLDGFGLNTDDIDALCVDDADGDWMYTPGVDTVWFSLTAVSASLGIAGDSPADIFAAPFAPGAPVVPAGQLGLLPGDELNALKCYEPPPPEPPETPSFSLGGAAPVSAPPDSILQLNPVAGLPPVVAIPGPNLGIGIIGPDDLNSLSYGVEYPNNVSEWLRFSVAPDFVFPPDGLPGTDVFLESTCMPFPGQAIGDEFDAPFPLPPPGMGNTNTQVLDETGVQDAPACAVPPGYPVGTVLPAGGIPNDDIDALEERPPSFVDDGSGGGIAGDAFPDRPVFFTLAPGSITLPAMGYSEADIVWSVGGMPPMPYAVSGQLGLISMPGGGGPPMWDAIDALMLYDNGDLVFGSGDWVWLSLMPGSPTLGALGATEADVLFVDGGSPGIITIQYFADQLGLNHPAVMGSSPFDDLNALKGEIPCLTGPDSDIAIGNGKGIPGDDSTVANGEVPAVNDCQDQDDDNDGYPDNLELLLPDPSCPAKSALTNPGGDITYDDDANGIMLDGSDDGPSWDTDGDAVLDGAECGLGTDPTNPASRPSTAACGGTGDTDTDGLKDAWETCKWGTNPAVIDSDSDALGDCVEAADVDANGVVNLTDVVNYAKAGLVVAGCPCPIVMPPAACLLICFGQDGDFDINGDTAVNLSDVVQEAKFGLLSGLCK